MDYTLNHESANAPLALDNSVSEILDKERLLSTTYGYSAPTRNNVGQQSYSPEYKDKFFAVLFVGHAIVVLLLALIFGIPNISKFYFTTHDEDSSRKSHGLTVFLTFLYAAIIASVGSVVWLNLMHRFAAVFLKAVFQIGMGGFAIASLASFCGLIATDSVTIHIIFGTVFGFLAISCALYYKSVSKRIPFAAANLRTASTVIKQFSSIIYTAYGALAVQLLWVLVWGAAMIGVWAEAAGNLHGSSGSANAIVALMLCSLFWGIQVIKSIVHCVTAGVVGEWWYHVSCHDAVVRSTRRATTTSFGSICLGSLVVAALGTLRFILGTLHRQPSRKLNACLESCISALEKSVQYFNRYAYCQVALYGKDFKSAGFDTMSLFRERGWSSIVNDTLISGVLTIGCFLVGGLTGIIGASTVYHQVKCSSVESIKYAAEGQCDIVGVVSITFVVCISIGFGMCAIASSVVESIVATIFVCFAQDPTALQSTNPQEFNRIVGAWQRFHPQVMAKSGPSYAVLCV